MKDEIKRLQNELVYAYQQITGKEFSTVPEEPEIIAAHEAAIEALKEAYWRDPGKELPEKKARVLVLDDDGIHIPVIEIAYYEGSNKYGPYWIKDSYEMEDIENVIGWRPLPEAENDT